MKGRWLLVAAVGFGHALESGEIPRQKTAKVGSKCGAKVGSAHFPPLALENCDEPLCGACPDLRGYWTGFKTAGSGDGFDRVEARIEQCGRRVIVSGPADGGARQYAHDFLRADGTDGIDDYEPAALPECVAIAATADFVDGCLEVAHAGVAAASRCLQADGTLAYTESEAFEGRVVMSRSGELASAPETTTEPRGVKSSELRLGLGPVIISARDGDVWRICHH